MASFRGQDATLGEAGCERAILIGYGPVDRAPHWFEVEAAMTDHGMPMAALVSVDGKNCTNLTTGESEPYAPGTSDAGLTLALADGAPVLHAALGNGRARDGAGPGGQSPRPTATDRHHRPSSR